MFVFVLYFLAVIYSNSAADRNEFHDETHFNSLTDLWPQTFSFIPREDIVNQSLMLINKQTYQVFESEIKKMKQLVNIISDIRNPNDTVDIDLISKLTKQVRLSSLFPVTASKIFRHLHMIANGGISIKTLSTVCKALGCISITITQYTSLMSSSMNDLPVKLSFSMQNKLKLLIWASRALQPCYAACSNESSNITVIASNTAQLNIKYLLHFPWIAGPPVGNQYFAMHWFYFGCLMEFIWDINYRELKLPSYGSVMYVNRDAGESDKVKLLNCLMDKYGLQIFLRGFFRKLTHNFLPLDKKSKFVWCVMEADRLNKLFVAPNTNPVFVKQFMRHFIVNIGAFLDIQNDINCTSVFDGMQCKQNMAQLLYELLWNNHTLAWDYLRLAQLLGTTFFDWDGWQDHFLQQHQQYPQHLVQEIVDVVNPENRFL